MFKKNSCIQRKCDWPWFSMVLIFLQHFAFPYLKVSKYWTSMWRYTLAKDPSGDLSKNCWTWINFDRCDQCGEGFIQGEGLKRHILRHKINEGTLTEEEKEQLEMAKKPCEHCGQKFADGGALKRLLKSHMGIKDYACTECGNAYSEKRARDNHYNIVHNRGEELSLWTVWKDVWQI